MTGFALSHIHQEMFVGHSWDFMPINCVRGSSLKSDDLRKWTSGGLK